MAEQKQNVLTPDLQAVAEGLPEPTGRIIPVDPLSGETGAALVRPNGRMLVDARLANTSPEVLDALRAAGARVTFVDEKLHTATLAVDPADLNAVAAATPAVISIREIPRPLTNAVCPSGTFVSEGVTQLKAALARSQFSVDGTGVTVGVMSDSYDRLGGAVTDVTNGELPGTTNPCGHTTPVGNLAEGPSGADEGRAMAQIVHDVAPGAKILFANAFSGEPAFAQSIRDLAAQGADIIVDDITYYTEPMYQDGVVAKAVRDVTAQGVLYLSSAANSNFILSGSRVGSYEAPAFRPTTCPAGITSHYGSTPVTCHDFDPGAGSDAQYNLSYSNAAYLTYSLGWSEPQNGVTDDLDLCLTDTAGTTVYGCAETSNDLTGVASEWKSFSGSGSVSWVIVRYAGTGTPRLKLISHRTNLTSLQYNTSTGGDIVGPTIFGHNASIPGVTVGAVPYNNSSALENYSSFGPALYCWQPVNGNTPSGPLTPCQSATVDISATDGGQNSFFGGGSPHRFYGTSAAAPHAAAVAALMMQGESCLTPDAAKSALNASGRTVGTAPIDGAGAGLIDATTAVTAGDCEPPSVQVGAGAWYRTPSVSATATAKDNRVVTAMSCTGGTAPSGLNTTTATSTWTVSGGDGRHSVTCSATDLKGNTTPVTADFGIDTGAPTVACRPLTIPLRKGGTVTADVSDSLSGPASSTVSARVSSPKVGTFSVTLTGSDVAGNTASVACSYRVTVVPVLKGPAKAKPGSKKTFKVSGLPSKAKVKWTVKAPGGKQVKKAKANKAGVAKLKVKLGGKGKYVVSVKAAGKKARTVVRVK
ncbi:MAG: S8 family serine peptidase [Candidatus Nanopelagicales bacterium]